MNAILIVKKDKPNMDNQSGPDMGPHSMANIICICDCILKDAKDGDEVTVTVKGKLIDHGNGSPRYIAASEVDGEPVEEMPDIQFDGGDAGESSEPDNQTPNYSMSAHDALDAFMKNQK